MQFPIERPQLGRLFLVAMMLGALAVEGCSSAPPASPSAPSPPPMTAAPTAAPSSTLLPNGIRITDLKVGGGPPPIEQGVEANVDVLQLVAGKMVADRSNFVFKVAGKTEYPGLLDGMKGMLVGGRRRIEVPAALAYGKTGKPPAIPPNSPLVYEVYLRSLQLPPYTMPSGSLKMPLPGQPLPPVPNRATGPH